MTTKFKIGDKVQTILDSTAYFIIEKIEITKNGVQYWPQGSLYISWPETDLELKKEKIKKYKYAFIRFSDDIEISNLYYKDDKEFAENCITSLFQKLLFTEREFYL